MKINTFLSVLLSVCIAFAGISAYASNEERDLKAVFIGRFANFIELPNHTRDKFLITVIDDNPFEDVLDNLYRDKLIHGKPIKIKYVTKIDQIEETDILFITLSNQKAVLEAIKYAQEHSILTISDIRGFAERGGIIQIYFVMQKTKLKINLASANLSRIKISAPLLSIAEVIQEGDK